MAVLFCPGCKKEMEFLPIYRAQSLAGVCRATIYYWIDKGWIHWNQLPSGRRMICRASLLGANRTDAAALSSSLTR